jgi:hypothetical protein
MLQSQDKFTNASNARIVDDTYNPTTIGHDDYSQSLDYKY